MLVLNEVDKLSREAQHSLRRTMEKYSASCRLILCCNSSSKVTEAIRSRCLNIRINAPSEEEVGKVHYFQLIFERIHRYFEEHSFNSLSTNPCNGLSPKEI